MIEKVFGTLAVIPTDAYIITADSASKVHDDTALTAEGYTESGELCGADTLVSARTVGTITEVGTAENKIEATIINGSGEDVTDCYTLVNGTLTIYPSAVGDVEEAISQIGTVTRTQDCKAKIDAARAAYEALTEPQKAKVRNYAVLTATEAEYERLERDNKNSSNSVETRDAANPVMYVMTMLVALGGIISVITINKKRRA